MNAGLRRVALAAAMTSGRASLCCSAPMQASRSCRSWRSQYAGLGVMGLWVVRLLVYAVWTRRRNGRVAWRSWLLEPVIVALVATAVLTGGAFRLRFLVSWPFLAQYAQAAQQVTRKLMGGIPRPL